VLIYHRYFNGLIAIGALGLFGLVLIWKGLTGDVMTTRMGDILIPRWMYVGAGVFLLIFPATFIFVRSEFGRAWMGL
jgi:hypothetical protein